jgi:hypothetical protein
MNIVTCRSDLEDGGLDWMIWFIDTVYINTVRHYRKYSAIAILHSVQFTVTYALGFSVFTSILATDLSQSYCHFHSHVKSSRHRLISFLPFLQLPIPKSRLDCTRLMFYIPSRLLTVIFYNPSARTTQKTFCIVKEAGLLLRCLSVDVQLSHAYASRECVCRAIA